MTNSHLFTALLILAIMVGMLAAIGGVYSILIQHKNYKLACLKYKDIRDWIKGKGPHP